MIPEIKPPGGADLASPAAPSLEDATRAQRLLTGAMHSALLTTPPCECGACRRLRKAASLTLKMTEEDLDDA